MGRDSEEGDYKEREANKFNHEQAKKRIRAELLARVEKADDVHIPSLDALKKNATPGTPVSKERIIDLNKTTAKIDKDDESLLTDIEVLGDVDEADKGILETVFVEKKKGINKKAA
jgi:hypothetical protein